MIKLKVRRVANVPPKNISVKGKEKQKNQINVIEHEDES